MQLPLHSRTWPETRSSVLLCEPNICEGRDEDRIDRFTGPVMKTPGIEFLHRSSDPDHHRTVLAYRGDCEAVLKATTALATSVFAEIDLRDHRGEHPRVGALDVVPFIRGAETTEDQALQVCHQFGASVGQMGVPVFYYERAATSDERAALPRIRAGEFEGLSDKLSDPEWEPDVGPTRGHIACGVCVAGIRNPLVRFNVNLDTEDHGPAQEIASKIRESGGGLPYLRALGIVLSRRGLTQVSMNLTRYCTTGIGRVFERVSREAAALGIHIVGSELIGPVPANALKGLDLDVLKIKLAKDQVLDLDAYDSLETSE